MQRTASAERLIDIPGYQILRRLNQSQFAATYLARHTEYSRRVVLKVFAAPPARQSDFKTRFLQNCQALGQLRHPNIIQLYEGGIHRGACYLSLEYVSGATRIDELPLETPRHGLQQVADLARALQCAHGKGFVHGCIEAARVLVQRERCAMLAGFEQQLLVSTPAPAVSRYLSPERKQGEAPQIASDIYSLGMLLYCLLVRRAPLDADVAAGAELKSVESGVPALPGHLLVLQPLINGTLAPSPRRRFGSAALLADAIDAVTEEDIEAIHIATPHYLASIRGGLAQAESSVPEPVPLLANVARPDHDEHLQPVASPPLPDSSESRRSFRSMALLLFAGLLIAGGLVLFQDRLPTASDLRTWAENGPPFALTWLQRDTQESLTLKSDEALFPAVGMEEESVGVFAPLPWDASDSWPEAAPAESIEPSIEAAELAVVSEHISAEESLAASDLVAEGDRLFAADALTVPREANALAAYQQALSLDPHNTQAWTGLQNIVQRYAELADARIVVGDLSTAAEFIRRGLAVDASNEELLTLQTKVGQTGSPSARPEDLEKLGAMARVQMVRENYVTPPGDSAYDHYSQLLLMQPGNKEAQSGLARIERELASEIELQVNRNRFDRAQALLVRARDAFPTSQRFHNLTVALEAAVESEQDHRASLQPISE